MKGEIEIGAVDFRDDGEHLIVNLELRNTSDVTLHAYSSLRGMRFDEATGVLHLFLTDRNFAEKRGTTFVRPRFTSVDPNGRASISLTLPRFLTRLAASESKVEPKIERPPIHTATAVDVELAWSDTPFYPDPRDKQKTMREQLVTWEQGVAKGRGGYPPPERPERPPRKKSR